MATGRVFTANVVLARHPGGEATQFSIGDDVPEWATDRVGEHVSQGVTRSSEAPESVVTSDDTGDKAEVVTETPAGDDDEDLDSYSTWTKAELKDEAKGREITGYSNMSKEELVAALEADDAEEEAGE